jgi:pSer/pThr/pTyr-binding forkhead associated (FHA) protein
MSIDGSKFLVSFTDGSVEPMMIRKDAIFIGRLKSSDVVLDHRSVSRLHAGINLLDGKYFLINLSETNLLTLNGRLLEPQETDVLGDGDIIQIGPYAIQVLRKGDDELVMKVQPHSTGELRASATTASISATSIPVPGNVKPEEADVLKVFWEKRTREKEDWGTRLRPTAVPQPGKAVINWKPTLDLRKPWRIGLFVWALLILGVLGAAAYWRFPEAYAGAPLAGPHAKIIENSTIAVRSNANSCTTCHTPTQPVENACIQCHQAEQFHASNTKAHEDAGVTCVSCHKEHLGADFDLKASAIQSCAECHNDTNKRTFNGKTVRTAHNGSYGYPVENGEWKWQGVYREVAAAIPEITGSATADANEQGTRNRQFHSVHVARLVAPKGMPADRFGLVSCSSCHKTQDPIDRTTPRETCAACHTTTAGEEGRDARFVPGQVNCISCHVQHPYSSGRWSEFLSAESIKRRTDAVAAAIRSVNPKE